MTPLKQKLSPEQIEDIVNDFPQCLAATAKVAAKMREQIQLKLRLQLKDIEIVNTPKAIDRLKEMIRRQHYNSLVHPGEPVGIRAAESLSQPTTQMALNAFHSAGFLLALLQVSTPFKSCITFVKSVEMRIVIYIFVIKITFLKILSIYVES